MSELSSSALKAVQMAYMAKDCVQTVHDQTSLGTAGTAVSHYAVLLTEVSQEDQRQAKRLYPDVPTLGDLLKGLWGATTALWNQNLSGDLAKVS